MVCKQRVNVPNFHFGQDFTNNNCTKVHLQIKFLTVADSLQNSPLIRGVLVYVLNIYSTSSSLLLDQLLKCCKGRNDTTLKSVLQARKQYQYLHSLFFLNSYLHLLFFLNSLQSDFWWSESMKREKKKEKKPVGQSMND